MVHKVSIIILLIYMAMLLSCASSGTLTGGPKDTQAPVLNTNLSTPYAALQFKKQDIVFEFDEFIDVKDAIKQIVVSPPLKYIPKIKARGRKIIFAFNNEEELKENTTYTINFGESIEDLNERNKLKNFKYVFSTGDYIDSLILTGVVKDDATGKPLDNITVLLYDDLNDSLILKERPFYFSKTDKEGKYKIENVKKDTFALYAIKDDNSNYMWNEATEAIGFTDSPIIWDTSIIIKKNLILSAPNSKPTIYNLNSKTYGKLKLKLSKTLENVPDTEFIGNEGVELYPEIKGDSLFLWYNTEADSFLFKMFNDSFQIKVNERPKPVDTLIVKNSSNNKLNPYDALQFTLSSPVLYFENCIVLEDSLGSRLPYDYQLSSNHLLLTIQLNDKNITKVKCIIPSQCMEDIFGNKNDSLKFNFVMLKEEELGNIKLSLMDLDSTIQYIFRLTLDKKTIKEIIVNNTSQYKWSIDHLEPGTYSMEYIVDTNKNGKWDGINFWEKKQAEVKNVKALEKLRENWTLESDIKIE